MRYIVSIHTRHDSNMTISCGNNIVKYVEFEKVVGERYFSFSNDEKFIDEFYRYIFKYLNVYKNEIIKINFCWLSDFQKMVFFQEFPECIFEEKRHHVSHAYSLYAFTKPLFNDLIISFDGGGDEEDCFKLFHWRNKKIEILREIKLNLGTPYRLLGLLSNEIKSKPVFQYEANLHLSGKIMGLSALGEIDFSYIESIKKFYLTFRNEQKTIYEKLKALLCELNITYNNILKIDNVIARNILRTSQKVFEDIFFENTREMFKNEFNRILLVGGCSLNINLNTLIFKNTKKDIFVSPVSGDCGISLGASLSDMELEHFKQFSNAFIGLKFIGDIKMYIDKYNARRIGLKELSELLSKGKVIATVVDKIEAGARSLGNRSLLASPLHKGMKDKLNKIKVREFFRPVAVMVTDKSQDEFFEKVPVSKYMAFSPRIKTKFQDTLSEIMHYDESCRIQTVTIVDGFIYDLLVEIGKLTNVEVLINTSFNEKGKPIINNLQDAFDLFETSEIDGLYIDGFLFEK